MESWMGQKFIPSKSDNLSTYQAIGIVGEGGDWEWIGYVG